MNTSAIMPKKIQNVIRQWKLASLLAVVLCVTYVMIFPLVQLCAYFEVINLDSWVGDVILFVFWPLFWLNDYSSMAHQYFVWLGEIYMRPFAKYAQNVM
jgi:hypothetical protein